MTLKDFAKWNNRAAGVYAAGVWTMIVSYAFLKYTGRFEEIPVKKDEDRQESDNPNEVVYETAHSKTTIVYKKDFVPFTTRIYNFFSGEPGSGDGAK